MAGAEPGRANQVGESGAGGDLAGQYSAKITGANGPALAIGRAYLPQVRERLRF